MLGSWVGIRLMVFFGKLFERLVIQLLKRILKLFSIGGLLLRLSRRTWIVVRFIRGVDVVWMIKMYLGRFLQFKFIRVVSFLEKMFSWKILGMLFFIIWYMIWVLVFSLGLVVVIRVTVSLMGLFFFINILNLFCLKIGGLLFIFNIVIVIFMGVRVGGIFLFIAYVRKMYWVIFLRFSFRSVRIMFDVDFTIKLLFLLSFFWKVQKILLLRLELRLVVEICRTLVKGGIFSQMLFWQEFRRN